MTKKVTQGVHNLLKVVSKQNNIINKQADESAELKIVNERVRQAKLAFNLLVCATVLSRIVSLVGIGLLFSGQISEGAITASGGLLSNAAFIMLAKDTNDRLDRSIWRSRSNRTINNAKPSSFVDKPQK